MRALIIAKYLTDELIRVFGLPVPKTISPNLPCRISTTFFVRKHLPLRRLCTPLLPIVVNPREPYVAMPLPARYWPQHLIDWWSGGLVKSSLSMRLKLKPEERLR